MSEIDKLWQTPGTPVRDTLRIATYLKEAFYAALTLRVDERGLLIGAHQHLRMRGIGQDFDDFKLLQEVVELRGGK